MSVNTQAPPCPPKDEASLPLVLILCTANSCRSQMAEGLLKAHAAGVLKVASAGSKPSGYVHPLATKVMAEIGIDISQQRSKSFAEFLDQQVETVIAVCAQPDEACPVFASEVVRHHWPFEDPAKAEGTPQEVLAAFRQVRDRMRSVFEAYAARRRQGLS